MFAAVHLLNKVQIKQEIETIYAEMVWNRPRVSLYSIRCAGLTIHFCNALLRSTHDTRSDSEPDHSVSERSPM